TSWKDTSISYGRDKRQRGSPSTESCVRHPLLFSRTTLVLEGLLALPRGAASVQRILRTYLDTTPALISALQEGFCQGDAMHVEQAAHSLKSSSSNVGALALAELARALEAMGRAQNLAQAAPLLAGIA
ncbi:MAG: Hpt domain-containing protein, partial [Candidatus Tectomicrobia bacterium]|nr:Hpt domain-containing protein [Candidatus Tectomicrobia bacterium]